MGDEKTPISGQLLDEHECISMTELCHICHLSQESLLEYVEYGVVDPVDANANTWYFQSTTIARIFIAARLTRDLEINVPGVALVLDLMDEITALRRLNLMV